MKLLMLLYSATDTCSFYRSGGIAPALEKAGKHLDLQIDVKEWPTVGAVHWQLLHQYDIVMLQRAFNSGTASLCEYIRGNGIPLWLDWDDLLIDVPRENKMAYVVNFERDAIIQMAKVADIISVPTEGLRERLSKYNPNIKVIPNAFNDEIFFTARKERKVAKREKLVLWRGSNSHSADLLTVQQRVELVMEHYPDWKFFFHGFDPWFIEKKANMEHQPSEDPMFYFFKNKRRAPYVMHAPLNDTPFNRCKSLIAYQEAAYFGAPLITPDWDQWILPGALNYHDVDGYEEVLEAVLDGDVDVEFHAKMAWEHVLDTMRLSQINPLRIELITELLEKRNAKIKK